MGLEKFRGWDSPAGGFEVLAGVGGRENVQDVRELSKKLTGCKDTGNCETTGTLANVVSDFS